MFRNHQGNQDVRTQSRNDNILNSIDINEKIESFRNQPGSELLIQLLQKTKNFLGDTDLYFQKTRESTTNDEEILAKLNAAAAGLTAYRDHASSRAANEEHHGTYEACLNTIQQRLESLRKKSDKISTYYDKRDNELKVFMTSVKQPKKNFRGT
jgi:hypothetical protein